MSGAYQDQILAASKSPTHRGALAAPARSATMVNRLCGDSVTLWLEFPAGRARLGFEAEGCALCRASAWILADAGSGRPAPALAALVRDFRAVFPGRAPGAPGPAPGPDRPPAVAALFDLNRFPSRERCVLLAWEALDQLLEGGTDP